MSAVILFDILKKKNLNSKKNATAFKLKTLQGNLTEHPHTKLHHNLCTDLGEIIQNVDLRHPYAIGGGGVTYDQKMAQVTTKSLLSHFMTPDIRKLRQS